MKRLILLTALVAVVVILTNLPARAVSDISTPLTDGNIPDNELKEK